MSDLIIKDGTGAGFRAQVDDANRLFTKSTVLNEVAYHSQVNGASYVFVSLENTLVSANGEYHLLWIRNTNPSSVFNIDNIFISYNGGSTTGTKTVTGRLRIGSSKPNANNTATTGSNINLSSGNVALMEGYYWNGTGTGMTIVTPGSVGLSGYFAQGFQQIPFSGSFILGFNNVIDISAQVAEDGLVSIVLAGWFDTD